MASGLTVSGEVVIYKDGEAAMTLNRDRPIPISRADAAAIIAWCCSDPYNQDDPLGELGEELRKRTEPKRTTET